MKYLLTILLTSIFLSGCEKDDFEYIPACLAEEIAYLTKYSCEGNVGIVEYFFQSTVVYFIDPGHCFDDQDYDIIDSDCEVLGTLGGIVGKSKINGVDFFKNAVFLKVVWEK
jgi:hypothetical protein